EDNTLILPSGDHANLKNKQARTRQVCGNRVGSVPSRVTPVVGQAGPAVAALSCHRAPQDLWAEGVGAFRGARARTAPAASAQLLTEPWKQCDLQRSESNCDPYLHRQGGVPFRPWQVADGLPCPPPT